MLMLRLEEILVEVTYLFSSLLALVFASFLPFSYLFSWVIFFVVLDSFTTVLKCFFCFFLHRLFDLRHQGTPAAGKETEAII
eukprot:m.109025 g.109025  ORF g.109025 m.109025 type:complete len:82 (+) comp22664_c0_seq2:2648-2893(+)